jgi:hypothetical protein
LAHAAKERKRAESPAAAYARAGMRELVARAAARVEKRELGAAGAQRGVFLVRDFDLGKLARRD